MKRFGKIAGLVGIAMIGAGAATSSAVTLPACNPGVTCLQIGDFNVFSLPLLNLQAGFGSVPSPGDPFFVSSTFGQIKTDTIIGINNGQSGDGNVPGKIDGAFNTPSANNIPTFTTLTAADPGGLNEFLGDKQSWDATVPTLLGIDGTPLVAYFAFNETGSGTGLLTTDLLIWAQVTLHDYSAGGTDLVTPVSFTLSADGSTTPPDVNNLPPADGSAGFGPWVYVHAGICVNGTTFTGFPDVNGNCAVGSVANQNNLGQNAAAFAIDSPALDAALLTGTWNVLSVTWEMGYINGGGETAFILPSPSVITVPEPATLALLALGLLIIGGFTRRRHSH